MPISGSENTDGVSAVARFISGVRFCAMKSRTSFSKPRSSVLKLRSMVRSGLAVGPPTQGGVAAIMVGAAAEQRVEGGEPLEIGADVEFFGDAHGAVQLHRLLGDEARAFSDLGFGARGGAASRDRLGIDHQGRAQRHRA